MVRRFFSEMRQRRSRRTFYALLGGKLLGIGLVLGAVKGVGGLFVELAGAQSDSAPVQAAALVNPINTIWVLVTAFLVFFMQAGFMMLEAGFARTRETVNILLECIVDTALCGILFWAFGFAFMFGSGNGIIGHQFFFLNGAPETYGSTGVAFMAFFLFQFAFADTCSTITSGAMVGRTGFKGDLLYSIGVSGFIYPIIGHWVWGPDGWLATMSTPFRDFAGSTVVHTIGGFIALAGAIVLGPRLGRKFKRDGGFMPPGHNMTIAAIGGVILWFGWYGFNPGSTLSALDFTGMGRVATNTTLAASGGALAALFIVYFRIKKWDAGITINGFLGGLVAITCPCYWVNQFGAICIGAIAAVVVVLGVDLLEYLRIDDPIGAVPVHGFCGIWGTLSLGLFATGQYGVASSTGPDTTTVVKGLFWGGGFKQLGVQLMGSAIVTASTFAIALVLMYLVKATRTLRISEEGELEGIDIHEHGAPAYHPEPAYTGIAPGGSAVRTVSSDSDRAGVSV
ncbi:MAG: ammonium transporter, Amt family [Acidimicrobiia bacterium]|jgi:Amt family ammonium transporter|nr:ammonium transporter, Amt family [Acidimicrobiia bacterium]